MAKVLEWLESQGHCHQTEIWRAGQFVLHIHLLQCALLFPGFRGRVPSDWGLLEARGTGPGRFGTFREYVFHFGGNVTLNFHSPPRCSLLASCPSMASSLEWSSVKIGSCLFWKTRPYEWVSAALPILRSAPDKSLAVVSFQGRLPGQREGAHV